MESGWLWYGLKSDCDRYWFYKQTICSNNSKNLICWSKSVELVSCTSTKNTIQLFHSIFLLLTRSIKLSNIIFIESTLVLNRTIFQFVFNFIKGCFLLLRYSCTICARRFMFLKQTVRGCQWKFRFTFDISINVNCARFLRLQVRFINAGLQKYVDRI